MGAIKSGIGPYEGPDHASPEPSLGQGQPTPEGLRLARGPPPDECVPGSPEALSSLRGNPDQIAAPTDQVAGAFNAKVAWHLCPDARPPEPKWPPSLRRSTDQPDRKTAPPASLRLRCHSTEWGWQAVRPGRRHHRKLRFTRPRARTRAKSRKTANSAPPDPGLGLGLSPGRWRTPLRPTQGSDLG
jgi:hypothetical protein